MERTGPPARYGKKCGHGANIAFDCRPKGAWMIVESETAAWGHHTASRQIGVCIGVGRLAEFSDVSVDASGSANHGTQTRSLAGREFQFVALAVIAATVNCSGGGERS